MLHEDCAPPNSSELPLQTYLALELGDALGPFNRWVTGVALKRPPTDEECLWHYIEHGGPEQFSSTHHVLPFRTELNRLN